MKLTKKEFEKLPFDTIFKKGEIDNSPTGLYMNNLGGKLKWVAKKGAINDWCIYTYWNDKTYDYVEQNGDKVHDDKNIKILVPCTDEVLDLYRY